MKLLVGVFVGGKSSRMGGRAKGLLPAPDGAPSLVERLASEVAAALPEARLVLVGRHAAYARLPLPELADRPGVEGPLGGLLALLDAALAEDAGALALACDLPYVTGALLRRLASEAPRAAALAPRPDGLWQPLAARYEPRACLGPAEEVARSGRRALQGLFDRLGSTAVELSLRPDEAALLRDWDEPRDLERA